MAFNYQLLMDEAVLGVVKKVLLEVQSKGIIGDQALYISFFTKFEGVVLPESVKKQYPREITIVLQHQFRNLKVSEDKFSVNIAFKGINENIEVPFSSITSFLDPVANFGFQFSPQESFSIKGSKFSRTNFEIKSKDKSPKSQSKEHNLKVVNKGDNVVVAIDKFRKNNKTEDKSL